jgi:hypothetical protein
MRSIPEWLGFACLLAGIVWLMFNAIFASFYREKENFVDRLVNKSKGAGDGKGS